MSLTSIRIAGHSDAMDINAEIVNVEMTILDDNVSATGFIVWGRRFTLTHDTVDSDQALVHLFISRVRRCLFCIRCVLRLGFCLCYRQLQDHDDPCLENDWYERRGNQNMETICKL